MAGLTLRVEFDADALPLLPLLPPPGSVEFLASVLWPCAWLPDAPGWVTRESWPG